MICAGYVVIRLDSRLKMIYESFAVQECSSTNTMEPQHTRVTISSIAFRISLTCQFVKDSFRQKPSMPEEPVVVRLHRCRMLAMELRGC